MKNIIKARRGGFTLVELLIVIIIIAILAGMMMMTTGSATDRAEATKIISDLRTFKGAALMYYVDHKAWPLTDGAGITDLNLALAPYLDRSVDTKYGTLHTVGSSTDARIYIGFTYAGLNNNVQSKLKDSAADAGLYQGSASPAPVYTKGETVLMPMK